MVSLGVSEPDRILVPVIGPPETVELVIIPLPLGPTPGDAVGNVVPFVKVNGGADVGIGPVPLDPVIPGPVAVGG